MTSDTADKFAALLESSDSEAEVQRFLEEHPWMLSGHDHLVTQLPLGAEFRVDFAYAWRGNGGDFLNLIEIERPDLEIFNSNDEFSQPFNHAVQQIVDWSGWCTQNRSYLTGVIKELLDPVSKDIDFSVEYLVPGFTLIAGRRAQISNVVRKRRFVARANSVSRTMRIQTYDDFLDSVRRNGGAPNVRCIRYKGQKFS